ncbi:MAG: T9SS type A sorting domain-containing protein [Bacteroidales bacterium]|nr:T9SS type A sorting domain-containing protein [Bacteroidales bacterium]
MKKVSIFILLMFIVLLLYGETMVVHTNSGDYSFDTEEILQITFEDVSVEDMVLLISKIPIKFLKNYPNPFNPTTTIAFEISVPGETTVDIYNSKGQKVTRLLNEELPIGKHSVIWDGTDMKGNKVSSGIYFYRISVNDKQKVNKMIMIK